MLQMSPEEVQRFLAVNKFGMLGLAAAGKAYIVPLFYGFDGRSLYFHTHPGLKDRFIDQTDEACFTVARVITLDDWASVETFGRLEAVTNGTAMTAAMNALMSVPLPPEWGISDLGEPARGGDDVHIYKLTPARQSGRKSESPQLSFEEQQIAFGGM